MYLIYDKAKLKDIRLFEDNGLYYLNVTYEYENEYGIYEFNIPKVHLPIIDNRLPDYCIPINTIDLGFGDLDILKIYKNGMNFTHTIRQIKKKPRKMTLAEIQDALGYEVELINE